jgi:IclR-like helix-turn-helix domain-containing protein
MKQALAVGSPGLTHRAHSQGSLNRRGLAAGGQRTRVPSTLMDRIETPRVWVLVWRGGAFVSGVNIMGTHTNRDPRAATESGGFSEEERFPQEEIWPVQNDSAHEFVLIHEVQPPRRIELARERMLMCRLYLGLIRSMSDDYGAEFASHSDSATFRTIGIYVFLRTVMCSPVRASTIAQALKLPRVTVLRRLQEMVKHGYVERVGNAYRVTDKVNIPDLRTRLSRRVNMIVETARALSELDKHHA